MSLIYYWPLDELTGSDVTEQITSNVTSVTGHAEATIIDGVFGKARDLNQGSLTNGAYIDLWEGAATAENYESWALSCWIKKQVLDKAWPATIWEVSANAGDDYLALDINSNGLGFVLYHTKGGVAGDFSGSCDFTDLDWHLVVIRSGPGATEVVIDGVVAGSVAELMPMYPRADITEIGAWSGSPYADFAVDDIAIFDHTLTDPQIANLYNSGTGRVATEWEGEAFVDWAADIDPITSQAYYACEIDDGVLDAIRPPISSWQATVQSGRASYAQAVIPAATAWVDLIDARAATGEMIIYRGVRYADGSTQESELARAALGDVRFDVGPTNATMTISGYAILPPPQGALTRALHNVRSESSSGGFRVRCDIDWFLRPGHTAVSRGTSFTVSYINYYVNSSDQYMDVGERAL